MTPEEIDARLREYPVAEGSDRAAKHARVRELVKELALELCAMVPHGREQSVMMTHLEDAQVWANKGIARWGK